MNAREIRKLEDFCRIIDVEFKNLDLLKEALTHRSYLNEKLRKKLQNNEKLEFLGDAVLELLVSKFLFDQYPNKNEGELTSFRAATVRTESLYEEAERLNFGKYLYMSKGEENTGGRKRPYILANAFEAILGAIYLDNGIQKSRRFLKRELFYKINKIVENRLDIDNKSKLQELSQDILKETPAYKVIKSSGPDHDKKFTTKVQIRSKVFGQGSGKSKQAAEQKAADSALKNWKKYSSKYFGID